jgi:hypothetical protein
MFSQPGDLQAHLEDEGIIVDEYYRKIHIATLHQLSDGRVYAQVLHRSRSDGQPGSPGCSDTAEGAKELVRSAYCQYPDEETPDVVEFVDLATFERVCQQRKTR